MNLTRAQLAEILATASKQNLDTYYPAIVEMCAAAEISTPLRVAHFLVQIGHETGDLLRMEENLNYDQAGLLRTWPKLFNLSNVGQYAHHPEKIANRAYGNRYGNGDEASGDGWRYRGRGLIQLTFKVGYEGYGRSRRVDTLNNPDIILHEPRMCVDVACWYWQTRGINPIADKDDLQTLRRRVNGGLIGIEDCQHRLAIAKRVLGI